MAGEGRTPSTKNARTSEQRGAGTGQHVAARVDVGEGIAAPQEKYSPSKKSGMMTSYKGESSPAGMVKDSGYMTPREETFKRVNAEIRAKLDGTTERSYFPTQFERQKGDYARDDKYAGSKPGYRPKQNQ